MRLHLFVAARRLLALGLFGASAACPSSTAPARGVVDAGISITDAGATACLDAWLKERGLNPYGDPPDTVYAGGNPTFDEASGASVSREEWVFRRHPEAKKACGP